ncbi:hypothetical protein [Pontibacillus salipaludis]|uniref:hypothetical protein n=1 Tax=Pontibacillus salipaludis TaxID=1697394 RepID=UPI0031E8469F
MNEEKKSLYFYMMLGYTGLLLIGLATMRQISVIQDFQGQAFGIVGLVLVWAYVRFMEKKLGISNKEFIISKVIFVVVFSMG